jgi:hypothetical protein
MSFSQMGQIQMGAGNGRSGWRGGTALFFRLSLRGPELRRTAADDKDPFALHSSCGPGARKLDESFFFVLDFGLMGGTHRFLGVLPEMIGL